MCVYLYLFACVDTHTVLNVCFCGSASSVLCSTGNIAIRKDAALGGLWETFRIILQFYLHILSLFITLKNILSDTQAAAPAGTNCDSASTEKQLFNKYITRQSVEIQYACC